MAGSAPKMSSLEASELMVFNPETTRSNPTGFVLVYSCETSGSLEGHLNQAEKPLWGMNVPWAWSYNIMPVGTFGLRKAPGRFRTRFGRHRRSCGKLKRLQRAPRVSLAYTESIYIWVQARSESSQLPRRQPCQTVPNSFYLF